MGVTISFERATREREATVNPWDFRGFGHCARTRCYLTALETFTRAAARDTPFCTQEVMVKLSETYREETPVLTSELPPSRPAFTTLRCDLAEYARQHTGPQSWSADDRVTGRERA